jgi:hypothetical protein
MEAQVEATLRSRQGVSTDLRRHIVAFAARTPSNRICNIGDDSPLSRKDLVVRCCGPLPQVCALTMVVIKTFALMWKFSSTPRHQIRQEPPSIQHRDWQLPCTSEGKV